MRNKQTQFTRPQSQTGNVTRSLAASAVALALSMPAHAASDAFSVRNALAKCGPTPCVGLFDLYENNRTEGIGNIITDDFLVAAYGLTRENMLGALDRRVLIPQLKIVSERLSKAAAPDKKVSADFRTYAATLAALVADTPPTGMPPAAADEVKLIMAASNMSASPVFGRTVDYSQYLPRARYNVDADMKRLFRAMKFAGQPLLLKASKATGVTAERAQANAALAEEFAQLALRDEALLRAVTALENALAWQYGKPEDLQLLDMVSFKSADTLAPKDVQASAAKPSAKPTAATKVTNPKAGPVKATDAKSAKQTEAKPGTPAAALASPLASPPTPTIAVPIAAPVGASSTVSANTSSAAAAPMPAPAACEAAAARPTTLAITPHGGLYAYAVKLGRVPAVLDVSIDLANLETGLRPADVAVGARLIPGRSSPDGVFFQKLVYPNSGVHQPTAGVNPMPVGLSFIGGQSVKGNALSLEWLAALGSKTATETLARTGETRFSQYAAAFKVAFAAGVASANGLAKLHVDYLEVTVTSAGVDIESAARGFWLYDRHATVLFTKQSMTPSFKSFGSVNPKREAARLSADAKLIQQLITLCDAHIAQFRDMPKPPEEWVAFKEALVTLKAVAAKGEALSAENIAYLNNLDKRLIVATGGKDRPIVADFHTNPSEKIAMTAGLAYPFERVEKRGEAKLRGGVFNVIEFKQPLAKRLTDEAWAETLFEQLTSKVEMLPSAPAPPDAPAAVTLPKLAKPAKNAPQPKPKASGDATKIKPAASIVPSAPTTPATSTIATITPTNSVPSTPTPANDTAKK